MINFPNHLEVWREKLERGGKFPLLYKLMVSSSHSCKQVKKHSFFHIVCIVRIVYFIFFYRYRAKLSEEVEISERSICFGNFPKTFWQQGWRQENRVGSFSINAAFKRSRSTKKVCLNCYFF